MYHRRATTSTGEVIAKVPGFHTNVRTKASVISHLIRMVRDNHYIERDPGMCDELLQYESQSDGTYSARRGCHDDRLMSRAIALWIHATEPLRGDYHPLSAHDRHALLSQ